MMNKEINIPGIFQELHGEKARVSSILMVYLTGIVIAGVVISQWMPLALPVWQIFLMGILFLDIGGGVVANFSTSTNQYYQVHSRLRPIFILCHIVHPAVLMWVFPASTAYALFVLIFTLGSAFGLNTIKERELQQNIAAMLVGIGIALSFLFSLPFPILYAFAPLFMVKLILGFSVQRPPC